MAGEEIDDPRAVRKCRATSKRSKRPCNQFAMKGGYVCAKHGGLAPQVKRKAKERLADLIDPERALRELAAMAYFDIRDLFKDGKLLPISEWPDGAAKCVIGFEVVRGNRDTGDGQFDEVIKPRILDKLKAWEMLGKHLNLFKEQVELSGGVEVRWKGEPDEHK